jgi:hypothetical protein
MEAVINRGAVYFHPDLFFLTNSVPEKIYVPVYVPLEIPGFPPEVVGSNPAIPTI